MKRIAIILLPILLVIFSSCSNKRYPRVNATNSWKPKKTNTYPYIPLSDRRKYARKGKPKQAYNYVKNRNRDSQKREKYRYVR